VSKSQQIYTEAINPVTMIGPYSCVGRPLGLVEIRYVLARLVSNFDLRLAQNPDEFEDSGKDHFGMVFDKLDLELSARH
jgi:tryprostatin B 6-hydroxylase